MTTKTPALVVVGAGFFGLTIAERFSSEFNLPVLVIEARNHIGGNAFSYPDPQTGIEVHKYGTHLFHTSNKEVWDYVTKFAKFNSYRHTVVSKHEGQFYTMPVNLHTISQLYGRALTPEDAREAVALDTAEYVKGAGGDSFEARALASIGPKLYKAFFEGYTQKQWQTHPSDLPAAIFSRLPVRFNFNNRYFSDTWEGLPEGGYGELFNRMAANPLIEIQLETDFFTTEWFRDTETVKIYTGALDRYFDYCYGPLQWRTLDFETETLNCDDYQGASVVNYPDSDVPFTRIHEYKHLHPERTTRPGMTIVSREFSRWATDADEPYYPVNSQADREKLQGYRKLMSASPSTIFGGRLGSYQYLDMHMAIASALQVFRNDVAPRFANRS